MNNYAYATVATNKTYIIGAIRLYQRLKYLKSKYPLIIIITNNISLEDLQLLKEKNIPYIIKPYYQFKNWVKNGVYKDTINKFQILSLIDYEKVVFLDADSIPYSNIDFLFSLKIKPNHFFITFGEKRQYKETTTIQYVKGGLFICKPNKELYNFIMNNKMIIYNYQNDEELLSKIFFNCFTNIQLHDLAYIPHFAGGPLKIWTIQNKESFIYNLFNTFSAIDFNLFFNQYDEEIGIISNALELYQHLDNELKENVGKIKYVQ